MTDSTFRIPPEYLSDILSLKHDAFKIFASKPIFDFVAFLHVLGLFDKNFYVFLLAISRQIYSNF